MDVLRPKNIDINWLSISEFEELPVEVELELLLVELLDELLESEDEDAMW